MLDALSYCHFAKIYIKNCTHYLIACMNYNYILLVLCALFAWELNVPRRVNVVVFNSRFMVLQNWIVKKTMVKRIRIGINQKKCGGEV